MSYKAAQPHARLWTLAGVGLILAAVSLGAGARLLLALGATCVVVGTCAGFAGLVSPPAPAPKAPRKPPPKNP